MNFLTSKVKRILFPPETTPLKWKILANVFMTMLCSSMSITLLFPFLPAMIKNFGISDEDTGYYAGLVASSMFIGRTLACYLWGWLADKFGRRPIIVASLSLLLVGMLGFGLSLSLHIAIITRFWCGVNNALVGTCKAIISEASDDTNQAIGMSVILTAWNFGLIVGPAVGGFLAQPAEKYPNIFPKGSFFDKFPFFLPCLLNCTLMFIAIVLNYLFLEETLVKSENVKTDELLPMKSTDQSENQDGLIKSGNLEKSEISGKEECDSPPFDEDLGILIESNDDTKTPRNCQSKCCCCNTCGCCKALKRSRLSVLLRDRNVVVSIAAYCMTSFVIIGLEELFPLWAATQHSLGGLDFSTNQIGTALLVVSIPLLVLQIILYPKFERRLGAIRVFQVANAFLGVTMLILPFINTYYSRPTVLWPLLLAILLLMKLNIGFTFSSTGIFVNNTVGSELLCSVNGLASTVASISRAVAPVVAGSAFAWSINHGFKPGFSLNVCFAFLVLSMGSVLTIGVSCFLPQGLNRRPTLAVKV